jgi:hypothetical protein
MDRTKVQQFAESIWQGVDYLNRTLTLQERVLGVQYYLEIEDNILLDVTGVKIGRNTKLDRKVFNGEKRVVVADMYLTEKGAEGTIYGNPGAKRVSEVLGLVARVFSSARGIPLRVKDNRETQNIYEDFRGFMFRGAGFFVTLIGLFR